jgi:integrase
LVTGSNPVSGATTPRPSQNRASSHFQKNKIPNYDTFFKKCDTHLRLYKVGNVYYYRRRINGKLIRVSLQTKHFTTALKRKKTLDLIGADEMFEMQTRDFKVAFEYDTEEELRTALEKVKELQINTALNRYRAVKAQIDKEDSKPVSKNHLTFRQLQLKFIKMKQTAGDVSKDSISAYLATFNLLKEYFKERPIADMAIEDFEAFRGYLTKQISNRTKKPISKRTVNKHIGYLKNFVAFAVERELLEKDRTKAVKFHNTKKEDKRRKLTVENYSNEEVRTILSRDYGSRMYNMAFALAVYTGMREGEIRLIGREDIKEKNGIYYFFIPESKSVAGIRDIPIHRDILEEVLAFDFSLFRQWKHEKTFGKYMLAQLYKNGYHDENKTKNFHTFRGTFAQNIIHNNQHISSIIEITQEIIGHDKAESKKLTIDTYAKNFSLELKNEAIQNVSFAD